MVILKDGQSIADEWLHLDDEDAIPASRPVTVSLPRWQAERAALQARPEPVGLRLEAGDAPDTISDDLRRFPLIVLSFATMVDGRLFTLARLLRERFGFAGELRARGDFILDQIFFLSRVGVDTFEPAANISPEAVGEALKTFSVRYQAATDEKQPLYRRARR